MGNLVLNGATSGATTLTPTDASTQTITLPASTGTIITTGSPQSGGVIQVVSTTYTTQTSSTTTSSYVDTGLTASITPKFATSKILVIVSQQIEQNVTSSYNNAGIALQIVRNSTAIFTNTGNYGAMYQYFSTLAVTGRGLASMVSMAVLDSPATTSSTTYKTQGQTGNSGTMYFQASSGGSSITLMEIAG